MPVALEPFALPGGAFLYRLHPYPSASPKLPKNWYTWSSCPDAAAGKWLCCPHRAEINCDYPINAAGEQRGWFFDDESVLFPDRASAELALTRHSLLEAAHE